MQFHYVSVKEQYKHLRLLLANTLDGVHAGHVTAQAIEKILAIYECLPLSTSEYVAANRRVSSATDYFEKGERGAAMFELRLLLKHVDRQLSATTQLQSRDQAAHRRIPRRKNAHHVLAPVFCQEF